MMNRLIYFMTGWLSTLSISNLMDGTLAGKPTERDRWRLQCNHRRLAPLALGTP